MRIIDLSLPLVQGMRGFDSAPANRLETDGWNATTLRIYSHCGTHMDAPRHFIGEGRTIDQQDLSVCVGPAQLVDLTPTSPRQLIGVDDLGPLAESVQPGDRILLRTDWSKRHGTDEYRNALPRISLELAQWLVEKQAALIGVEPPSVADVNDMDELTAVHQTLLGGGVVIVEGLANLDRIAEPHFDFIALPIRIAGCDGSPVRAIAIESPDA